MLMGELLIALYFVRRRVGSVGIETMLLAGRYGVRVPTRAKSSLPNARTSCGTHTILWGPGLIPEGKAVGCEVHHLPLMPRLRMSGVVPPRLGMSTWHGQERLLPPSHLESSHQDILQNIVLTWGEILKGQLTNFVTKCRNGFLASAQLI